MSASIAPPSPFWGCKTIDLPAPVRCFCLGKYDDRFRGLGEMVSRTYLRNAVISVRVRTEWGAEYSIPVADVCDATNVVALI